MSFDLDKIQEMWEKDAFKIDMDNLHINLLIISHHFTQNTKFIMLYGEENRTTKKKYKAR